MKKILTSSCAAALALSLAGCATVLKGTTQTLHVASDPPGATIEVNGVARGTTPADVTVKKGMNGVPVVLKMAGYEDKAFTPPVKFDAVGVLNVFAIVGFGVDYLTGAMMKYAPASYSIPLTPLPKK